MSSSSSNFPSSNDQHNNYSAPRRPQPKKERSPLHYLLSFIIGLFMFSLFMDTFVAIGSRTPEYPSPKTEYSKNMNVLSTPRQDGEVYQSTNKITLTEPVKNRRVKIVVNFLGDEKDKYEVITSNGYVTIYSQDALTNPFTSTSLFSSYVIKNSHNKEVASGVVGRDSTEFIIENSGVKDNYTVVINSLLKPGMDEKNEKYLNLVLNRPEIGAIHSSVFKD